MIIDIEFIHFCPVNEQFVWAGAFVFLVSSIQIEISSSDFPLWNNQIFFEALIYENSCIVIEWEIIDQVERQLLLMSSNYSYWSSEWNLERSVCIKICFLVDKMNGQEGMYRKKSQRKMMFSLWCDTLWNDRF